MYAPEMQADGKQRPASEKGGKTMECVFLVCKKDLL